MERTLKLNINSDKIRAGLTKVNAGLKKTQRVGMNTAQMVGKAFKGLSGSIFSLKGAVVGLVGAAGLGALAKSFVEASSVTEGYATRLTVLLGSVEEGGKLFDEMADYASKVPFEFEKVMSSATQLAGIMKGGVDEIKQWMPLIGDLAATSGLSIEKTTEQVSRMLSAGAASADLFRERGITAMLGFQSGVSYSIEETRTMLMNAWDDPMSKFNGATAMLAKNWDGIMSMIADKWFQLQNVVMDAGLMDYFKAIAMTVDQFMGSALDKSKTDAGSWAQTIIGAIESVTKGVAYLGNAFQGLNMIWQGLKLGAMKLFEYLIHAQIKVIEGFNYLADIIPGIDPVPLDRLNQSLMTVRNTTKGIAADLQEAVGVELVTDRVDAFFTSVKSNLADIETAKAELALKGSTNAPTYNTVENTSGPTEKENELLARKMEAFELEMMSEEQRLALSLENRQFMVEEAFQNGLIGEQTRKELLLGLENDFEEQKTAIAQKGEADRRAVMSAGLGAAASIFSSISQLMAKEGKKQSAMQKILAKASIITSTAQAVMNALAVPPYPLGVSLAAAAALQGALQLSKVGGSGGGAASGLTPVSSSPNLAATPIATPTQVSPVRGETVIQFTGNFTGWNDEVIDDLTAAIAAAVDDRDVRLISPDSRNAQDLAIAG